MAILFQGQEVKDQGHNISESSDTTCLTAD